MASSHFNGFWVFAEQRNGELHEVGLELLGKARELADQAKSRVTAVLLGHNVRPLAQALVDHGADSVLVADSPVLETYRLLPYVRIIGGCIRKHHPEVFLLGATAMGVELAPRVAARVGTGLSAHCVDLRIDGDGRLLQIVPGWGGGVVATISCPDHRPQMATVMPGTMKASSPVGRSGEVEEVPVDFSDEDLGPEVVEVKTEKPQEWPLEKADVVVVGGWGVGNREDWAMIEELAGALGGAVGATRPAVDEGWAEEDRMIGQSGKTVRPLLYIGVGISGLMHHVVGMDQSKHVIAINRDPHADIFDVSDVIVVEDFRRVVPRLIEEIRSRRKGQVP